MKDMDRPVRYVAAVAIAALVGGARPARAADSGCTVPFSASDKTRQSPAHVEVIRSAGKGEKPKRSEAIYAGGKIYVTINGQWKVSPISMADMQKQQEENRRNSKYGCRLLREESVDGEPASVFHVHSENDDVKSDGDVWVSRSRGLILREEIDMNTGDPSATHVTMRYDYRNVQPPRL